MKQRPSKTTLLWQKQWEQFAPNFQNGYAHVNLKRYGGPAHILKLAPGPGFGDLSHPTTNLMLQMMGPYINGRNVIDIGCGSGILGLAASYMGAKRVWAVDIDEPALAHAKRNASINKLEKRIAFSIVLPALPPRNLTILINMISSEQEKVWEGTSISHLEKAFYVTSGLLSNQKNFYLCSSFLTSYKEIQQKSISNWLGLVLAN